MSGPSRGAVLPVLLALVLLAGGLGATPGSERSVASPPTSSKMSAHLAALSAGAVAADPRIGELVPGYRKGELAYFALADAAVDAARREVLEQRGARILRTYRTVDAVALASTPAALGRIATLPWVERLEPVELVFRASHERETDQSRGTTGDLGAPALWDQGITGEGVTVAVLDTGLDVAHPDLDDLDFRHWSSLLNPAKVVEARNFVGGGCLPAVGDSDGHGHGTHVAGIAVGTGEGTPVPDDDGRYAGVAPGARLAVGKVLTDAGVGLNSDLLAALEWAATPAAPGRCAVGADIVNLSLGSESRPTRLDTGSDADLVSLTLNRLAARHGTLFTVAAGNSGPYLGSVLESPGAAAQALSVAATAKDWDVNRDATLSGDTCAGWRHPRSPSFADNDCSAGIGDQPSSVSSFSSRGPAGDLWLRPDVAAPGYNIVSAQASSGAALAQNDLNLGTRTDPLYATATGTSMAAPAAAGAAALLLDAYRRRHGADPAGASGLTGFPAPSHALLRAALMNTAQADLFESRWILTTDAAMEPPCPFTDPLLLTFCEIGSAFTDPVRNGFGSFTLYEVRNRAADPYVGPLAEGAGKLRLDRAVAALRDGVVAYSVASGSGADRGTGPQDLQGTWQIGPVAAGATHTQRFVLHSAPGAPRTQVRFSFTPGNPSDGSRPIAVGKGAPAWSIQLPSGTVNVPSGGDVLVKMTAKVPSAAVPGHHTGVVVATISNGQVLRIPVFASVALHDANAAAGVTAGSQWQVSSIRDVFGKADTSWPSAAGAAGTGAGSDWLVFAVELAGGLREARFGAYDAVPNGESYDLYLYDGAYDLIASTHPFATPGVTDPIANDARDPSTQETPQRLVVSGPVGGRHYLVVSRAKLGLLPTSGSFGAFVLTLDEVA